MSPNRETALRSLSELLLESREKRLTFKVRPAIDSDDPFTILLVFSASDFSPSEKSATWKVDRDVFKAIDDGAQRYSQDKDGVEIEFVRQGDDIEVTMSVLNQESGSFETLDFKMPLSIIKLLFLFADKKAFEDIDQIYDDKS